MNTKVKSSWSYLEVNRGRFLCEEHGSFCDSTENYVETCSLCAEKNYSKWHSNPLDRGLTIVRNLQKRSIIQLQVVTGLFGSVLVVSTALGLSLGDLGTFFAPISESPFARLTIFVAIFMLAVSVCLFLASLKSFDPTKGGKFKENDMTEWERLIAQFIEDCDWRHTWAGRIAIAATLLFVLAFSMPMVANLVPLCCK